METTLIVKAAQAAEVAGVGYEGFRTWLKRGLLKETGILPKFYAAHVAAEPGDAKRWRWSAFGFADLCSFRLTKVMLDAGLPWDVVNSIVSNYDLWQSHHTDDATMRYLAVFAATSQYTLYSTETLASDLNTRAIRPEWMTLIDLHELRQTVVRRTRAATLKAIADEVTRTSHIFVRSGRNMLPPDESEARRIRIEQLGGEIAELAAEAERGSGSYAQFDALLRGLHGEGKYPNDSAVSAVAAAFTAGL